MKKFRVIRKDSSLKSGSRERCLPQSFEDVNIRFKIPVQEEFISCKKVKIAEEDLLPRCAVQTWVSRLTGLTYYWSHGGFCFIKRGLCSFTSCVVTRSCSKATSGLPLELAFQKHHVISLGGLVVSEPMQHLLIGESHQITWGLGNVWTSHASWSA